ncbi:unnamed protein product [Lathyrus sativus]|nr:unnamed protein product [Lathyrus sativus]
MVDNYYKHNNGRIWILWDETRIKVTTHTISTQFIHYSVSHLNGIRKNWLAVIYTSNALEQRKGLWKDLTNIQANVTEAWCLMGDYNNVLRAQDRIGGNMVTENEYKDLIDMMDQVGLYEKDGCDDHFTWCNNQRNDMIYSRIDRVLGNINWL